MQVRRKKTKQIFPPRAKTTPPILEMSAVGSDPDVPISELLFELPIQEMLYELSQNPSSFGWPGNSETGTSGSEPSTDISRIGGVVLALGGKIQLVSEHLACKGASG